MQSDTIGALAAALAKAQGEIAPAPMDRDNPFFKSKYATLTSLWESARAALSKNGLAVTQVTDFDAHGDPVLITTLLHSSGEWIGGVYPVKAKDGTPQALGSALTYARRYAFGALVGLTSDDDDDGNAAQNGGAQQQTKPAAAAPNGTTTGKATANGSTAKGNVNERAAAHTTAFNGFMARGNELFGSADWADARHWLIARYTAKLTPNNVRESANDLTQEELVSLRADMDKFNGKLVSMWEQHKTERRTELDGITVNGTPEMAH